ncbi:methylated-DNA--[protein]-cysteine S-methyltransferase [Paenibacillus methanolicus]|uniref:Methylated-DNA--protein-cysteine methyltransferase n=1 Tax=Paenibacillus methanolicus TaxID=582686 RepID=A0A5S5CIS1_9BACL|nr:methylated-DNA--[protein]-cysteine S-methyltransferase [Paenibacillus methanolicus]TYP79696.1 methylated-DNA-[protein]-cysteine S-methyltransferase [Paenibacillus methanolicus]
MTQTMPVSIRWAQIDVEPGPLLIAASPSGLCYVGSPGASYEELERGLKRAFPGGVALDNDEDAMAQYAAQVFAYLKGEQGEFTLSLDLMGTPFQRKVWQALLDIPYGQTSSYSEIAQRIGRPDAVRAVGTAIGANPVLIGIPCHRVIGKNGALTGYRGGLEMKRHLLELERRVPSNGEIR